ncbi:MAG: transcription termination/antitermination protein NusA, partial [Betaproteobacteria bacterium]|nr:transcription termination/antitermination protein NusA [Betaproteobacteria bacterium]
TVRRIDHNTGDVIIEAHRVECRLRRSDAIPKESLRQGDRVRALIKENGIVEEAHRGLQVYLTRAADDFLRKLFEREVPEIEKGVLEIVSVARHPGYRSKIAVRSLDPKVDPVGTCVGIRGSRVQSVTAELAGERVDIVQFEDVETDFVLRSLAPAEVVRVRLTGEKSCDVIVDPDNLAQAIGKDGMNVRLASKLTGWHINITDPESSDQMENERMKAKSEYFMEKLDIDASVAEILYTEGFNSVEDIAEADSNDLAAIEDFDGEIAAAVHERACEAVVRAEEEYKSKLAKVGKDFSALISEVLGSQREDLAEIMRSLITSDVLDVAAMADLSIDEILEICGTLSEEDASQLIVTARKGGVKPETVEQDS